MIKIGKVELKNDLLLAPLAGVTDKTFRSICKEFGVALTCTEMISAKGLMYDNVNTSELLKKDPLETPIAVQIFGSDPDIMGEQAKRLEEDFDIIDINMGCPVKKIVQNGEGSALMKDIKLASKIIEKVALSVKVPVTVKFRKGFDEEHINALDFAKMAEDSGASMITVHGRTREQFYSGKADWDIIRQVKENVKIPVVGNGDVFSFEDANRLRQSTNCDGIMVARGILGNPWLIQEILENRKIEVTPQMRMDMVLKHAKMLIDEVGEERGMIEFRKYVLWYVRNLPNSAKLRGEIALVKTFDELSQKITKIL